MFYMILRLRMEALYKSLAAKRDVRPVMSVHKLAAERDGFVLTAPMQAALIVEGLGVLQTSQFSLPP
jgi:hypothetical protein